MQDHICHSPLNMTTMQYSKIGPYLSQSIEYDNHAIWQDRTISVTVHWIWQPCNVTRQGPYLSQSMELVKNISKVHDSFNPVIIEIWQGLPESNRIYLILHSTPASGSNKIHQDPMNPLILITRTSEWWFNLRRTHKFSFLWVIFHDSEGNTGSRQESRQIAFGIEQKWKKQLWKQTLWEA